MFSLLAVGVSVSLTGESNHRSYKGQSVLRILHQPNLDAWVEQWGLNTWTKTAVEDGRRATDVVVNQSGIAAAAATLGESGKGDHYQYRVMIDDLDALITSQREVDEYHELEEIHAQMKLLAANFPSATYVDSIGDSHDGNKIPIIKFGGSESKLTFWIQGCIHAREWISPATVMYMVEELLSSKDPKVQDLVKKIEFAVAPCVNPDGYKFTWSTDRLWRKNRRPDGLCHGVDMNRNWGEHWGECGASTSPCSDTYRGPSSMSEPEVQAVANYVTDVIGQDRRIVAAIDFHAYGELILRPYGWALPRQATPETDAETKALAERMKSAIQSVHGRSYTSEHAAELYCASGGADDWFFAVATKRAVAGGLCIELRDTGRYGFLLPEYEIEPTGEENLAAVLLIAAEVTRGI
eukprot:gene17009-9359_t